MIKGSATLAGTKNYAAKYPLLVYKPLIRDGICVSGAGFGCYRVDVRVEEHQQALTTALLSGINIIDTSTNYADGGSEQLVGKILHELVATEKIKREEIVVVSKVGYLQGENYNISQERKQQGCAFKDLVIYGEGLEHCIHPDFLAEQLTRSLERLGLETIDCYLLHNPEYYLYWAKEAKISKATARVEYLRRIRRAFLYLETQVQAGRINYYGLSSNTFPRPASHYDVTSLADIWELAEEISPNHHFRVIQFPLNLVETGGVTENNQPGNKSLLEFSREQGLGVLINRPLNAIRGEQLIRLDEKVYEGELILQAKAFKEKVASLDTTWSQIPALSQLALRALRSTAGIGAVLVGMRQKVYVEDVLQELKRPCTVSDKKETWLAIKQLL